MCIIAGEFADRWLASPLRRGAPESDLTLHMLPTEAPAEQRSSHCLLRLVLNTREKVGESSMCTALQSGISGMCVDCLGSMMPQLLQTPGCVMVCAET